MFDSLDKIPWVVPFQDDRGKTNTKEKRYTIAHEIGHALGLDHIGVIMKTPYCMEMATYYYGGSAFSFYYGQAAPQWMGANAMGKGSTNSLLRTQSLGFGRSRIWRSVDINIGRS